MNGATTFKATMGEHGVEPSKVLVRAWCHRMQFFYDAEREASAASGGSTPPAVVARYIEPTELTDLANNNTHEKWRKWMGRIAVIRAIPRS